MTGRNYAASPSATSVVNGGTLVVAISAASSADERRTPARMPAAIPADQAYYWTHGWQADVSESREALRRGDYEDFDSDDPNDVARWLLSDD